MVTKGYKLYDMQSHKFFISCDVKFCEDHFPFSPASQTLTLVPSTTILPLHDSSYSNIYSSPPAPSIPSPTLLSPPPSIPSPTSLSPPPSIPSLDSPTNSNFIPPDTSVPLRCSTRTKELPAWHNDYEISSATNHLTSSSSPSIDTRYPLHHYISLSFSLTQRATLALIIAQTEPKT